MTDNEIIKALEGAILNAKRYGSKVWSIEVYKLENSIDLITRLQAMVIKEQNKNSKLRNERNRLQAQNKDLAETIHNLTLEKDALFDKTEELKAEVERLKNAYKQCAWERDIFAEDMKEEIKKDCSYLMLDIKTIKAEAYKECIEKVKTEIDEALKNNYKVRSERAQAIPIYTKDEFWNYCAGKIDCLRGLDDFCDNLLKELVGDK